MKKVICVIDMLNGFTKIGPLSSDLIKNIIPNIENYLNINKKINNLFICDSHSKNDIEMKQYPLHCLVQTEEAEIVSELLPYVKKIVFKNTTNAFHHIDINEISKYDSIEIVGCCTDICVLQFAISLKTYFNKILVDKEIIVYEDLVTTFDSDDHNANKYHSFALSLMKEAGIVIKAFKDK